MNLTAENVNKVFVECLFKEDEVKTSFIPAIGITTKVGFNPTRLEENREEILKMLQDLPEEFQEDGGGGMSFLQACQNRDGEQWTGSQQTMQELFLLGLAAGYVVDLMPRNMWGILPGGMPYYMVKAEPLEIKAVLLE